MNRFITAVAVALFAALSALSGAGCSSENIYPSNPYTSDPVIRTVAVAPFILPAKVAMQMNQPFMSKSFQANDGTEIAYSVDFAEAFAYGLTNFEDLTVIKPDTVYRAWMATENTDKPANPLASAEQARTLGRMLKADAIIVAEVLEWSPYEPHITLDWQVLLTSSDSRSASGVVDAERSGRGTSSKSDRDYGREPVFAQQLNLMGNTVKTNKLLEEYSKSLATIAPYTSQSMAIKAEPFPSFVRFSGWVAMCDAFRAHKK